MSIGQVCDAIKDRLTNPDAEVIKHAEDSAAAWINLLDSFDRLAIENVRLKTLISETTSEIFKEIHVSLVLSVASNYGAASVLARGCIEKSIYILYFIDHPMAAFKWAMNNEDLSFSSICEAMSAQNYFEVATGEPLSSGVEPTALLSSVRKIYRLFSESVHGKYSFMEGRAEEKDLRARYYQAIKEAATALNGLVCVRV